MVAIRAGGTRSLTDCLLLPSNLLWPGHLRANLDCVGFYSAGFASPWAWRGFLWVEPRSFPPKPQVGMGPAEVGEVSGGLL